MTAPDDSAEATKLNRELFAHFNDVFRAFTGCLPDEFVPKGSSFAEEIRRLGARLRAKPSLAAGFKQAADKAYVDLQKHYRATGNARLRLSAAVPGQKLVLGGSQGFSESSLHAVRSMLMYADTVIIPDPVQRWTEIEPVHEAFAYVRMLKDIFHISKLKPLVDADLPTVPLVVFPSWEKLMEEHDQTTKDGIERLAIALLAPVLGAHFDDIEEVTAYVRKRPSEFIERIAARHLFVPLGGEPGQDVSRGIAQQRKEWARLRSDLFMKAVASWTDAEVAYMTILERISPQFHVIDNAQSLNASPLFALPVQWHYFDACYRSLSTSLEQEGVLSAKTLQMTRALSERKVAWLGCVPVPDLVRMRSEMANVDFRRSLTGILSDLEQSPSGNLDSDLCRVTMALDKLLVDHDKEARKLDEEYRRRYAKTAAAFLVSIGAAFLPSLPIIGSAVAVAAAGTLAAEKIDHSLRRRHLSRTLMGVLAASARNEKKVDT